MNIWYRYRNNFLRHIIGVSLHLQSDVMDILIMDRGHSSLKLNFEPYISLLVNSNLFTITNFSTCLGVSKQVCSQVINEIENAGYIERIRDSNDGRVRILSLTKFGHVLVEEGIEVVFDVESNYSNLLNLGEYEILRDKVHFLYDSLELSALNRGISLVGKDLLIGKLSRISLFVQKFIMDLTVDLGHFGLKISHGQVLRFIGPDGGRIHKIASIHKVSKQAISMIVKDLENLGYLVREKDLIDRRGVILRLTSRGEQLLEDSISSVNYIENEFKRLIGEVDYELLSNILKKLYLALPIEEDIFEITDLLTLSLRLKNMLGIHGSLELSRLLSNTD